VVAFLPGITTPFKATHQAIDDLALMRALAGMTVVDPADATELSDALELAVELDGPVYLRGLRGTVAQLFDPEGFEVRAREVTPDGDVGLISTGLATQWALEAAELLAGRAAILHVPVLKPFPAEAVVRFAARFPRVTTVENHSIVGGLGSAVAEALAEAGGPTQLQRLGVPDRWAPAGSLDFIRRELGLDARGIAETVR
jgi:transketolase